MIDRPVRINMRYVAIALFNGRMVLMGLFLVIGLFAGDMPLFLRFDEVKSYLLEQYNYTKMTHGVPGSTLFVDRLSAYFTMLIPAGTFLLWIPFYLSFLVVWRIGGYRKYIVPLTPFFMIYLILMAKGYPLLTIRTVLPLFPYFVIISILTLSDFHDIVRPNKLLYRTIHLSISLIVILTIIFSFVCSRAMGDGDSDPFRQLYSYLNTMKHDSGKPLAIGILADNWWNTVIDVHVKSIVHATMGDNVSFVSSPVAMKMADYVIVYNIGPGISEEVKRLTDTLVHRDDFMIQKKFKKEVAIGSCEIKYEMYPHDFHYAFPLIFILKKMQRFEKKVITNVTMTY